MGMRCHRKGECIEAESRPARRRYPRRKRRGLPHSVVVRPTFAVGSQPMGSDAKDHTAEREAQCDRSPTPMPGARSPEAGARSPEGRCHLDRRRHRRGLLHRAGRSRWSCDSAHRQGNSGCGCDLDNCVGHVLTLDRRNLVAPRPVPSRHLRCRHRSADGWVSERCAVRLVTSCCQAIPTQDARDAPRFNPDPILYCDA